MNIGSRFCSATERNYDVIKGELLGLAWALEKTRHWTLGCPWLLIFTDHKPLLGLLKQRDLEMVTPWAVETYGEALELELHHPPYSREENCNPRCIFQVPMG